MFDADTARAAALEGALAELQQWGADRFSMEGVAHRSHVSPDYLARTWQSERQLIVDAVLSHTDTMFSLTDTGSLRGDLNELALALAEYLNQPVGRRIARMMVVDSKSQVIDSEIRSRFWSMRRDVITGIFRRAARRGELRPDVRPAVALQLLTAPLHSVALYSDQRIDAAYCRALAELVTRALVKAEPNHRDAPPALGPPSPGDSSRS